MLYGECLLTYSMEKSPSWEANWFSASQEIPRILWNPKVPNRIHKCPPHVPILSQLDPVHTPTSHFLKIHLNIILPSTPGSPKWPLSLRFAQQTPLYALSLPHTRYMPCPTHSSRFKRPKNIWRMFSTRKWWHAVWTRASVVCATSGCVCDKTFYIWDHLVLFYFNTVRHFIYTYIYTTLDCNLRRTIKQYKSDRRHRVGWPSTPALYFESHGSRSRPGHRLQCLRFSWSSSLPPPNIGIIPQVQPK